MKYNHTWLAILALFINKASAQVDVYPWPNTASQSNMYSVKLTQDDHDYFPKELLSKPQLEEGPDGNGVTGLNHDRTMTYVPFSYTDKVKVTARKLFGKPAKRVEISPKSFGIEPLSFDGRTVEFILPDNISPAYISINFITSEINDNDNVDANNNEATTIRHGLVLFADQPETNIPDINQIGAVNYVTATRNEIENADLLYFPTGDHNLIEKFGKINSKTGTDARIYLQKNNQQIYLQPGAVIRGSIDAQGHDGISVSGRGLITGADFHWHYFQGAELTKGKEAFLNFTGCDNCTFNGFIIDNPTHHTLPSSNNTTTKNIKIIGWASNQDGIRPANNSVAEQVFIKTSDDLNYARNSNQTLKDSVIWPMRNGALGMLGWNNLGTGGTIFKNLYVINAEWDIDADQKRNTGIIGSVLNQGVNQANNTVEDLYAEWGMGMLANISIIFDSNKLPSTPENNSWGVISDFTFKNILLESTFQNSGGKTLKNQIKGFEKNGAKAMIKNFTFINVVAGNTVISNDNAHLYFDIDDNTTENINFITEGKFHTLTVTSNDGGYVSPKGNIPTPEGMKRYLTIIADEGKSIESVSINGKNAEKYN